MFIYSYLLLNLLFIFSKSEDFEEFYNYVGRTLSEIPSYTMPKNNEQMCVVKNPSVKFVGKWDIIIIGGGSAGSLLAGRLTENHRLNVLLLEAGEKQTEFTDIPGMSSYSIPSNKNWGYLTSPQSTVCLGMVNNSCVYPRGKVLGGCAVINALVNARGVPNDFNDWEKLGNTGWSYNETLPFFKSFEVVDFPNADPSYYGQNGHIHVNYTSPPSPVADAFLNANIQNGLSEIDYNGKGIHGVSRIQFHIKKNKRDNSAHAFLDSAQNRPNLEIKLNAFVTKILVRRKKAYGVKFIKEGQTYIAFATKEVILSAGAINSPQILWLSGIGPASELKSIGIKPIHNLPAVGKHLKDHSMFINLFIRTNQTSPVLSLRENLQRYVAGETPFTNGGNLEHVVFLNSKNDSKSHRDIELISLPPPFGVPISGRLTWNFKEDYDSAFGQYNALTDIFVAVIVLQPKSEGSVTLKSASSKDFPNIDIKFFSDPNNEDIETMYRGIQYVISLTQTPAFKKLNASYVSIQPECEHLKNICQKDYWYCAIRHSSATVFHPVGTTRMGISAMNSVVNTNLKVHGMENLMIVDAGVMPNVNSGHTNSPTYMIAEKISHQINLKYRLA